MTMLAISWQNYATVFVNYWIQTDRQTDILIHTNGQTLKQADRWSETHGYMDRLAHRWTDKQTDRQIDRHAHR